MNDEQQFRQRLISMNYQITEIEEGIDNLFQAISTVRYGSDARHDQVRAELLQFMNDHENALAFNVDPDGTRRRNPSVAHWLPSGGWLVNWTLVAASIRYQMVVMVISIESDVTYQYPEDGGYEKFMVLSHNEIGHFNLLTQHPTQGPDEEETD